jgi:hypothetical protein
MSKLYTHLKQNNPCKGIICSGARIWRGEELRTTHIVDSFSSDKSRHLTRIVTLQLIYSGTELAFIATVRALLIGTAITRVYLFRYYCTEPTIYIYRLGANTYDVVMWMYISKKTTKSSLIE